MKCINKDPDSGLVVNITNWLTGGGGNILVRLLASVWTSQTVSQCVDESDY